MFQADGSQENTAQSFDVSLHQLKSFSFVGRGRGLGCSRPHVEGGRAQVDEICRDR